MPIKADSLRILFIDGYFIDPIVFDTISKQLFSNTFASFLRCDKKHLQASVLRSHKCNRLFVFGNNQMFNTCQGLWNILLDIFYFRIRKE